MVSEKERRILELSIEYARLMREQMFLEITRGMSQIVPGVESIPEPEFNQRRQTLEEQTQKIGHELLGSAMNYGLSVLSDQTLHPAYINAVQTAFNQRVENDDDDR